MKLVKTMIALTIAGSVITAAPTYRLVSSDRGVIISVTDLAAEPEMSVDLIDENLSLKIKDADKTVAFENTTAFPGGFWADSLTEKVTDGNVEFTFYNFSLSIEDMQKKFSDNRLLLLVSPTDAMAFDKKLLDMSNNGSVLQNVSIVNRDGLEFVSLNGFNLGGYQIMQRENGISLTYAEGVKVSQNVVVPPAEFLLDSVRYTMTPEGTPSLELYVVDGAMSLIETSDEQVKIVYNDLREQDQEGLLSWRQGGEIVSAVLDESRGKPATVIEDEPVEVVETPVSSTPEPAVKEVVEQPVLNQVMYVTKNEVNVRSTPSTKDNTNIVGKVAFGTKLVAEKKEGSWYFVSYDNQNAWIFKTLVTDSSEVTDAQWDAIYNSQNSSSDKPVIDEFNSPGKDPLLSDEKSDVFSLDSASNSSKPDEKELDKPEVTKKKEVVIKSYKKYGRDPFLPLNTSDFVKPKLPKVDNLNLVGIIYDPAEGIALFEEAVDGDIVALSMRSGTRVENGKLLRIYENKVVFLMQESDVSYTVEKELMDKKE